MTAREETTFSLELAIHLRLAVKNDLPKLEWHGQYTHFRNQFRRAFLDQQQGRRLMVIADCNGFPVGQIFVLMSSAEGGIADGEARAYLYAFRVMEMFRGMGLGTRLIEEAEAQVWARGFRWTTIAVAKTNAGAQRLYRRMGYQVFRDDPGNWSYTDHLGKKHYVHEPCWLLEKELDLH